MLRKTLLLAVASIGLAAVSHAQLAFSSFTATDGYNSSVGATISGPTSVAAWWTQAMQFQSAASGVVDVIRVAEWYVTGDTNVNLVLYQDDGSGQIGANMLGIGYADSNGSSHINSFTNPFESVQLVAGQKYWLQMETFTDGWHAWNQSDPSIPVGRTSFSNDGGATWSYNSQATLSAFDVTVRPPVPEPASMLALTLGSLALLARRRKRSA